MGDDTFAGATAGTHIPEESASPKRCEDDSTFVALGSTRCCRFVNGPDICRWNGLAGGDGTPPTCSSVRSRDFAWHGPALAHEVTGSDDTNGTLLTCNSLGGRLLGGKENLSMGGGIGGAGSTNIGSGTKGPPKAAGRIPCVSYERFSSSDRHAIPVKSFQSSEDLDSLALDLFWDCQMLPQDSLELQSLFSVQQVLCLTLQLLSSALELLSPVVHVLPLGWVTDGNLCDEAKQAL